MEKHFFFMQTFIIIVCCEILSLLSMKKSLIICLSILYSLSCFAQRDTVVRHFGDVVPAEFQPSDLEQFTDSKAIILLNQRVSTFNTYEHQVMFFNTYHIRYKALKDNFIDNNQMIVPFSGRFDYEKVLNTKVRIYRLVNQKVVEHKVKYKNFKVINRDSINSKMVINFPEIKAGDIVDIQYTKVSFNYSMPDVWHFHSEYPCLISQAVIDFPDFIEYDFKVTGDNLQVDKTSNYHFLSINENFSPANGPVNAYSERGQMLTFRFSAVQNVFTAYNTLPIDTVYAFMPQKKDLDGRLYMRPKHISEDIKLTPYMTDVWGRLTRLLFAYDEPGNRYLSKFEVWNQIQNPGYIKFESNNWKRFTKEQRRSSIFWKPILKSFVLTDELSEIYDNADAVDSLTLLKKLYSYLTHKVKWDGTYSNAINRNPETVMKLGVGSSAEINGALVALLRRAGFNAKPVYAATRDFGSVDSLYVNTLQYNNILAYVSFVHDGNDYSYVIDATNPNRDFDVLNIDNINNLYLVMDFEDHFFVSVEQDFTDNLELTAQIDGSTCSLSQQSTGVFVEENHIDNSTISFNSQSLNHAFKILMRNNPFPELVRNVPVDFVVPRHYTYKVKANSLDANGFSPQEFSALDGRLNAVFSISKQDSYTVYQIDVNISTPFFGLNEYDELRMFFDKLYSAAE